MSASTVLHIGTEKTGTKTIQEFLHCNRRLLGEQGWLYTKSTGVRNNRKLSLLAYPDNRRDDLTVRLGIGTDADLAAHRQQILEALGREISCSSCKHVAFSSEHLQSRLKTREEISRLRAVLQQLGLERITIVVYLRDPGEICRSLYASSIVTGGVRKDPPGPEDGYFGNICNHRRTIENWTSVFGEEAVHPRLFEPECWPGGSLVRDFCAAAGIETDKRFVIPSPRNESLSHLGVELLRRINEQVPRIAEGRMNHNRAQLVELVREYISGRAYVPPAEVIEAYRTHFADSNEWVRAQYFSDRSELFTPRARAEESSVAASASELDAMARLVVAAWQSGASASDSAG